MANLVEIIKQASKEGIEAGKPVAIMFGKVTSVSPLEINVEQKLPLSEKFLILTNAVKDHIVRMTVNHKTDDVILNANHTHQAINTIEATATEGDVSVDVETQIEETAIDLTHQHSYTGTKEFFVNNGLKVGESVILLRVQGGQKYIVLDRVVLP